MVVPLVVRETCRIRIDDSSSDGRGLDKEAIYT